VKIKLTLLCRCWCLRQVPVTASFFHSSSQQQLKNLLPAAAAAVKRRSIRCLFAFSGEILYAFCGKKLNHREHRGIQHKVHGENYHISASFFYSSLQQ
jgi:hypothetical protein